MGTPLTNEVTVKFEDIILTENEIKEHNILPEDIFELKLDGIILGPFHKQVLKENQESLKLSSKYQIKSRNEEEWVAFFSHIYFQRRKPSIVPPEKHVSNEIHVYGTHGEVLGPFTIKELEAKLKNKELLFTDQVSLDNGLTFLKVHEIKELDRRYVMQTVLPQTRPNDIAKESHLEAVESITSKNKSEEDAIAGLAFINKIKDNKVSDQDLNSTDQYIMQNFERSDKATWKSKLILGILVFAAIGYALTFLKSGPTKTSTTIEDQAPIVAKPTAKVTQKRAPAAVKPKPKMQINRPKVNTRKGSKGKSFKSSQAYTYTDDFNDSAVQADFVEGEMLSPEYELTEEDMARLEEKLSKKFNIQEVLDEAGPDSENELFDEEASF